MASEDLYAELVEGGIRPRAAGYCEWISEKIQPRISIGWAWFLPNSTERHALAPGGISSNLMLRTKTGYDLGPRETKELLRDWLSGQHWQAGLDGLKFEVPLLTTSLQRKCLRPHS